MSGVAKVQSAQRKLAPSAAQRRFFFFGVGAVKAPVQKRTTSFALWVIIVEACRLLAATARPRAEPAIEFAPLSHMLMNGFFLVQGFFMGSR